MMRIASFLSVSALVSAVLTTPAPARLPAGKPAPGKAFVELGRVPWLIDRDEALAKAKASGKPLMVLVTELPGCVGCKVFANRQLMLYAAVDQQKPEVIGDGKRLPRELSTIQQHG